MSMDKLKLETLWVCPYAEPCHWIKLNDQPWPGPIATIIAGAIVVVAVGLLILVLYGKSRLKIAGWL